MNKGAPLDWVTKQMEIQVGVIREWPRVFGYLKVTSRDQWEKPSAAIEEGTLTSSQQRIKPVRAQTPVGVPSLLPWKT